MKRLLNLLLIAGLSFWVLGCDSSVSVSNAKMSSSNNKNIGSLSGNEDLKELLQANIWKHLSIDLDLYRYDRASKPKTYEIDMSFTNSRVTGIADCKRFSARYKVNGDELSFSKVHIEEANDLSSCKGFIDAIDAVNAFFSDTYTLSGESEEQIVLTSDEYQSSVTLSK